MEVDFGLRAAWGLSLTVAAGGFLCLLGIAYRPVLLGWMFAGIALATRPLLRGDGAAAVSLTALRARGRAAALRWDTPARLGLLALAGYLYVGAAAPGAVNPSDDWIAYLPFTQMIPQTGTFIDPFSVRRMAAYGGQSYLQAITHLVADPSGIQLFDQGISLLILVAMVLGFSREARSASRLVLLAVVLMVLMLPIIRINSASGMSGAMGFVAAFRTMVFIDRRRLDGWRAALLVALPIAATCTFRQNFLAVAAFLVAAIVLTPPGVDRPRRLRQLGQLGACVAVCLLGWAALAYRSNHTFLFPMFPGNYDPDYAALTAPASWAARVKVMLAAIVYGEPIHTMPLLLLVAPAAARRWHHRPLLGLWLGTMVGFAFIALSLPDADNFTIGRYSFAFIVAFAVAVGLAAAEHLDTSLSQSDLAVIGLVLVALGLQIHATTGSAVKAVEGAADRIRGPDPNHPPITSGQDEVRAIQSVVPAGAPMLVMVERPYLLDYARNPIRHIDLPGAASPAPRLPLNKGAEKIAAYLQAQGIRYFAFARPDKAQSELYSRANWNKLLTGRTRVWRITAPLFLAIFDAADELAKTRRHLFDDGHFVTVDLATPTP